MNPFTLKVQTAALETERKEILQEYQARSTQERLSGFVSAGKGLMVLVILISIITEFAFLYLIFYQLTGGVITAIPLSLIGVIMIEWMKMVCGPIWFKFIFMGWIKDGSRYILPFVVLTLIVAVGFGGSAYLSINGAPLSVENIGRKVLEPNLNLVNLEEIHTRYDALVAQERQVQDGANQMTWHGRVVSDGREIIATSQQNVQEIERRRTAEIEQAYTENNRIRTEYTSSIASYGNWFKGFGGIAELIGFLLLLLYGQYRANVAKEHIPDPQGAAAPGNAIPGATPSPGTYFRKTANPLNNTLPYQQAQIGFKTPPISVPQMSSGGVQVLSGQQNPPVQPTVTNTVVQTIPDNRVVYHNGKAYTEQMIINRIRKHTSRVEDAQKTIADGKGTQRTQNALINNQEWIQYWEGKRVELKSQQV